MTLYNIDYRVLYYTCYDMDLAYDINFYGVVNLVASKTSLQTNQIRFVLPMSWIKRCYAN